MDSLISHLTQISTDAERYSAFSMASVALIRYITFCEGIPSDADNAQLDECKTLLLANEGLSAATRESLELLYTDKKPIFIKVRKYLDVLSTDDLVILKTFVEKIFAENKDVTEQEQIALDKFISYYEEKTNAWQWERSTEKWLKDLEESRNFSFTFSDQKDKKSNLKKTLSFSAKVIAAIALVAIGIASGTSASKYITLDKMSDKDLLHILSKGVGNNTGEDIATRAHYIMEAHKRGLDF